MTAFETAHESNASNASVIDFFSHLPLPRQIDPILPRHSSKHPAWDQPSVF